MVTNLAPKRVAIAQPTLAPGGGTEAVTAWTIEALKEDHQVTLITFSPVEIAQLNRFYGTRLNPGEFELVHPPLLPFLSRTRRFSILKDHLIMRYCKAVRDRFDLFICPSGVMDFGCRGVQYVGLGPGSALVKVLGQNGEAPGGYLHLKRWFMRGCQWLSGFSEESTRQNITLAPSQWAGKVIEGVFAIHDYRVVYPPIDAPVPATSWESRRDGFLCVARIIPEKRIEAVIEILRGVRESGYDISLRIIGRQDDPNYARKIRRMCRDCGSWISLDEVLDRSQLLPLLGQYKYGIHGALDEPFGIAIAEMVKAGCIVFVPNGGGQVEIVDSPNLTYAGVEDGVFKITGVLGDSQLQSALQTHLATQGELFSSQAFCGATRSVVREILDGRPALSNCADG